MEEKVLEIITVGHLNPSTAEFVVRLHDQRQICARLRQTK